MTYTDLKAAIEKGSVTSFDDFFSYVSQKQLIKDLGITQRRLKAIKQLPLGMTLAELARLSDLIGVNAGTIGVILRGDHLVKMQ